MDNLFSGLESMGLGGMKNLNLFDEPKKNEEQEKKKAEPVQFDERTLILDKTFKCPVCDREFKNKVVKAGKTKLVTQDIDLRPQYADIDALKYGVVACPICGYASMARTYAGLTQAQCKLIKEQIATSFTGYGKEPELYSYDDAIARHKLALLNTVVKRAKTSERAYMCLLIAWLLRGKRNSLPENTPNRDAALVSLKAEETDFLSKARDGLKEAFQKEAFPLCGLDENTSIYMVAALCYETGMHEESLRWASRLITSTSANDRIKERARNLKTLINSEDA